MSVPTSRSPSIDIVEVGPRDGLQDEALVVPTDAKLRYINGAVGAGVRRVELTSFVNPKRVPQMADAEAVVAGFGQVAGVIRSALVLNERGLERALAAGVDEVNVVVIVTDTFGQKNQGMSVDEMIESWRRVAAGAAQDGVRPVVTLAAAFGCPFEGEVAPDTVVEIARRVADAEPAEISLADTIGAAVPQQVSALVRSVAEVTGRPIRGHFHNSRNAGYANALAAVEAGATALDASTGGIGGCPFAPGATGNVATEDLVYQLERSGISTGIDLDALLCVVGDLEVTLGHDVPGQLAKTGPFPRRR